MEELKGMKMKVHNILILSGCAAALLVRYRPRDRPPARPRHSIHGGRACDSARSEGSSADAELRRRMHLRVPIWKRGWMGWFLMR